MDRASRDASVMAREREHLHARAAALIDALAHGGHDDDARDALLVDIARFQARYVEPYRRLVKARGVNPGSVSSPDELPAMPTDVFRVARVAAHPPDEDIRVFLTSGTTSGARGAHHARDLSLYDRAARAAARQALFPEDERMLLVSLVPAESEAPESSLGYMVARFQEWFGAPGSVYVWQDGTLNTGELARVLDEAARRARPVALLGTSFAFVYAEDGLGEQRWQLAPGSRIMQTGGFKGRTRQVEPPQMRALLAQRYGVEDAYIIAEYGMTELSSQMYESTLVAARAGQLQAPHAPRRLTPPGWMRVVITDPDTLAPLDGDAVGLIRIEDPASVDTAWAVQTSDLGRRVGDGLVLLGRAGGATPRGCSLAVEEALGTPG